MHLIFTSYVTQYILVHLYICIYYKSVLAFYPKQFSILQNNIKILVYVTLVNKQYGQINLYHVILYNN